MKKLLILLALFLLAIPSFSQNGNIVSMLQFPVNHWDSDSNSYINYTYGFVWHLNGDMNWANNPTLFQKGALFAAKDIDSNSVAYVVASHQDKPIYDIWQIESEFKKGLLDGIERQGGMVELSEIKKCMFAGVKALKTKLSYSINGDDRFQINKKFIIVNYVVARHNATVTFSIMTSQEFETSLNQAGNRIESTFFNGIIFSDNIK